MNRITPSVFCLLALTAVQQCCAFSMTFNNSLTLDKDGKYELLWNFNATDITFQVRVQTTGYIGFGITSSGDMYPADVIVGWVKDGRVHFSDRHTTAHAPPVLDKSQDWHLIHGEEANGMTVLTFTRKIETCDDEDEKVLAGTVRLIYSWHPADPTSDTDLLYHGAERRGAKSVSLLNPTVAPRDVASDNIKIFDFRNQNYEIPSKDTTYLCTGFQMPNLGGKHHMIEFEPIFTPGNEPHVHHIVIQRCPGTHPSLNLKTGECFWGWPKDWPRCPEIFIAWATGGGAFYMPEHTGYSVGADDDYSFYVMQTHYDNPAGKSGMIDSSGIRMKLTNNLRQHDIGTLILGHDVNRFYHVIPPQEPAFISAGYCAADCLAEGLSLANETEIKMVAQLQHAHLLGASIKTRHFRNGVELEPLADDPNYDFDFQQMRKLTTERTVMAGDSFTVECTYNSMKRSQVAFGGLSTRDEMCLTFVYHYPKLPIMSCNSQPTYDTYNLDEKMLRSMFTGMNWMDPAVKADFKERLANSTVKHTCFGGGLPSGKVSMFKEREVAHPYVPPKPACGKA